MQMQDAKGPVWQNDSLICLENGVHQENIEKWGRKWGKKTVPRSFEYCWTEVFWIYLAVHSEQWKIFEHENLTGQISV